jgi:hypothetical protein
VNKYLSRKEAEKISESLDDTQTLALISNVYDSFYRNTNSFENHIGPNLAYLLGSIATGGSISLNPKASSRGEKRFLDFLYTFFPHDHKVWAFVDTSED